MAKTLKDIIKNNNDIYQIKVFKPSKRDHSTWTFKMVDPRWTDESFKDYTFKPVYLRRDNGFFLAYKSDESNAYFVDPKRAMYRNSVPTYVKVLVDYSVKSNDISKTKNDPSFRITQGEMKNKGIENFLDLCYEHRDYTAIGTGYTRDVRNLVVMDIDVDCTKPDNKEDVNNLLLLFAKYNSLPDFYIFNHQSKHIQLQWLIQDLQYKDINNEVVTNITNELNNDTNKNRELDYRKIDFTEISPIGIQYRKYTLALCEINSRRKFGDRNYTFWKAKNPMSALAGIYELELKMPYYSHGEIKYYSDDEMWNLFSSKEARRLYYGDAPTLQEWYNGLSELLDPLVEKVNVKKMMKINDAEDVSEIKPLEKVERKLTKTEDFGESRNTYVINCTRHITLETFKRYGYRSKEDINKMSHEEFNVFKSEIYNIVHQMFKNKNEKYGGIWPDTTNISVFSTNDFRKAFNSAFQYAINNINNFSYSNEDRMKSQLSRCFKKEIKLILVDKVLNKSTKITRKELLKEVNSNLKKLYIKPITLGSLKRYIAESNELDDEDRERMNENLKKRKEQINKRRSA